MRYQRHITYPQAWLRTYGHLQAVPRRKHPNPLRPNCILHSVLHTCSVPLPVVVDSLQDLRIHNAAEESLAHSCGARGCWWRGGSHQIFLSEAARARGKEVVPAVGGNRVSIMTWHPFNAATIAPNIFTMADVLFYPHQLTHSPRDVAAKL